MSYRPRLSDGREAPMPWQIRVFSINICWPLEADSSWLRSNLDRLLVIITFIFFFLCNVAAFIYIITHLKNIELVLDNVAPYVLLLDLHFRIFNMAFHKRDFRKFLEEFYAKIYIEKESNNKLYRSIKRSILLTVIHSCMVLCTFCGNTVVVALLFSQRPLPLKMILPFDINQLIFYLPTLAFNYFLAVMQTSFVVGESYLLATCILHLNARYQLLQQDCQNLLMYLTRTNPNESQFRYFPRSLMRIIQRNVELNEFAAKLRVQYSWRVFIMIGISSIFMCVLSFMPLMFGVSFRSFAYIMWFSAKTLDLFIFGQLGSKLISTTSEMGSMYYGSHWEDVIQHSSNDEENAKLMKLIALAIEMNQNPMYVTGLSFFNLSLPTFLTILQGTYTYFSCFYALRYS